MTEELEAWLCIGAFFFLISLPLILLLPEIFSKKTIYQVNYELNECGNRHYTTYVKAKDLASVQKQLNKKYRHNIVSIISVKEVR